jgi:hypothetical protein
MSEKKPQQPAQQPPKVTLPEIVNLAAGAAETAEPGSAQRALAHIVRLLASRVLELNDAVSSRVNLLAGASRRHAADIAEITRTVVALGETLHEQSVAAAEDHAGADETPSTQDGAAEPTPTQTQTADDDQQVVEDDPPRAAPPPVKPPVGKAPVRPKTPPQAAQ